ncbi:MAG: glycosyltransferase family 1 protein [Clostridiales bacterium]|nr:glycosyltransferase family 1 protein [Clostridiales bacterium]
MKTKVLMIMNSLNCGGEENFVMNLYRKLDLSKIQVDFLVTDTPGQKQFFENEIEKNGSKIYKVPGKIRRPLKTFHLIYQIVKENQYKVVHRHSDNSLMVLDLWAARLGGAVMCIAHSHNSNASSKTIKFLHYVFRPLLNVSAEYKYACGIEAGKWLYGKSRFRVIKNGIDVGKFALNPQIRCQMRQQLGIRDAIVIGHIGRFDTVKNHEFLISVFELLNKRNPSKYKLVLVGMGDLEKRIKRMAYEKNLEKQVIFLGRRNNTQELLQAMDLFVFPSLYEGVPLALIEAQASGTRCLVSDTISEEVAITPLVEFLPLDGGIEKWVDRIDQMSLQLDKMKEASGLVRENGYDIENIAYYFETIYRRVK